MEAVESTEEKRVGITQTRRRKTANCGDHYQFVATKSVLKRAVSKEILTKRGLVSMEDYYRKVAHI